MDADQFLKVECARRAYAEALMEVNMPDAGPLYEPAFEVVHTELRLCEDDIRDLFQLSEWPEEPSMSPSFWLRGLGDSE